MADAARVPLCVGRRQRSILWAARLRGIVQPSAPSNVIGAAQVRGGSPPGAFNGAAQSLG